MNVYKSITQNGYGGWITDYIDIIWYSVDYISQDVLKMSLRRLLYVMDVSETSQRRPVFTGIWLLVVLENNLEPILYKSCNDVCTTRNYRMRLHISSLPSQYNVYFSMVCFVFCFVFCEFCISWIIAKPIERKLCDVIWLIT